MVRVGDLDRSVTTEAVSTDIKASFVRSHEFYNAAFNKNDIAIVTLATPLTVSTHRDVARGGEIIFNL